MTLDSFHEANIARNIEAHTILNHYIYNCFIYISQHRTLGVKLSHIPGAFQVINKSIKECKDKTNNLLHIGLISNDN